MAEMCSCFDKLLALAAELPFVGRLCQLLISVQVPVAKLLTARGLFSHWEQGECTWSHIKVLKLQTKPSQEGLLVGMCTREHRVAFSPPLSPFQRFG